MVKNSKKIPPLFMCDECKRKFYNVASAERAAFGDEGCPGCGGSDIVEYYVEENNIYGADEKSKK